MMPSLSLYAIVFAGSSFILFPFQPKKYFKFFAFQFRVPWKLADYTFEQGDWSVLSAKEIGVL
jgi:hypothetical protein